MSAAWGRADSKESGNDTQSTRVDNVTDSDRDSDPEWRPPGNDTQSARVDCITDSDKDSDPEWRPPANFFSASDAL